MRFTLAASLMRSYRLWATTALVLSVAGAGGAEVTLVGHGVPAELEAATRQVVPIEIENRGSSSWDPDAGFAVSYHWFDRTGVVVVWDGVRTALPATVEPGDRVRLDAIVEVPRSDGELVLQWDVVQEGVRWLSELDQGERERIPVTVRPGYAFSIVRGSSPLWMFAQRTSARRLVVRNDGTRAWPAGGDVAMSYHWLGDGEVVTWDGARTVLPEAVEPGETTELEATVRAPKGSGLLNLQWDMVREGVAWFSERDPTPEPVRPVLVVRFFRVGTVVWALASLAAAGWVVTVVRRARPDLAAGVAAGSDVTWCAGALVVKQQAVLSQAGLPGDVWTGVISLAGVAVLLLPALLLPRRVRAWSCWVLAAAATALLFADVLYARFFEDLLSLSLLGAASQLTDVRASVVSLLGPGDAWFWLDLAAGAVIVAAVARMPDRLGRRSAVALAAVLSFALAAGAVAGSAKLRSGAVNPNQVFRNLALAREVGVLNYHALDAGRELAVRLRRPELEPAEVDRIASWFAARAPVRAGVGPWFGAAEGANVVMVQAESLQGFVLGLEVAGQEVTPFLNRWAEGAILFRDTTDQTAQGRSSDAELLTQVSLLPPAVGAAPFLYPDNHFTGLASLLADRGYATVSAVAYDGTFWNRRWTHPAYGFAESLFAGSFEEGEVLGWGLNDRDFFSQMVGRLTAEAEPFCALLLTLSLHHPFEGFPDHLRELELGDLEARPLGRYLHTMRFFDHAFATLMAELEGAGLADSTVVVVWGDHDAGLEWSPELAAMAGQPHDDAGWYLSQRVPLLIRVPTAVGLAGESDIPAGHQDVAPTVLGLLGVDSAPLPFIGRNLLGNPGTGPVVGEYHCWKDDRSLYLQGAGGLADGRCFELPTLRPLDPSACAAGFEAAREQVAASRAVLEHDLQVTIRGLLAGGLGADP
jgi:phosphoglycerol transferase MdoB-like AlkP superfamily enzyme